MRVYIIRTSTRNFSWNFLTFFQKLPLVYIFFSKFQQILLKSNTFLNFHVFSGQFLSLLLTFYQFFCKFLNFFFKDLLSLNKITAEICPNFYSGLLKNFLAGFRCVFKCFLLLKLFFSQNEMLVISSVLIFLYCVS